MGLPATKERQRVAPAKAQRSSAGWGVFAPGLSGRRQCLFDELQIRRQPRARCGLGALHSLSIRHQVAQRLEFGDWSPPMQFHPKLENGQ